MNRDDILRMADESGLDHMPGWLTLPAVLANLERFAALVAAAEREACAQELEGLSLAHPGRADLTLDQCIAAIRERGE